MHKHFKDWDIVVGGGMCQLVNVESDSKITCIPPPADSKLVNQDGNALITVISALYSLTLLLILLPMY